MSASSTHQASRSLLSLPHRLLGYCLAFLDGLSLCQALASAKWPVDTQQLECLFKVAVCHDFGPLAHEELEANASWRRLFQHCAANIGHWSRPARQLVWQDVPSSFRLCSSAVFTLSDQRKCAVKHLFSKQMQPQPKNPIPFLDGDRVGVSSILGREVIVSITSAPSGRRVRVFDLDGKRLQDEPLAHTLSWENFAFGRLFGLCSEDQSIHVLSLESMQLDRKIPLRSAKLQQLQLVGFVPLSPTAVLSFPVDGAPQIVLTPNAARSVEKPEGGFLPVCDGVVSMRVERDQMQLRLLRVSELDRGHAPLAHLPRNPYETVSWCTREPTRDLVVIAPRDGPGDVVVFNLRGEVVCRLQPFPSPVRVVATRTAIAFTISRHFTPFELDCVQIFDFRTIGEFELERS